MLLIAVYERQAKQSGALTFYETVSSATEKIFDALPRWLKRMCWSYFQCYARDLYSDSLSLFTAFFEGLAGSEADIDAVRVFEVYFEFKKFIAS